MPSAFLKKLCLVDLATSPLGYRHEASHSSSTVYQRRPRHRTTSPSLNNISKVRVSRLNLLLLVYSLPSRPSGGRGGTRRIPSHQNTSLHCSRPLLSSPGSRTKLRSWPYVDYIDDYSYSILRK